MSYAYILAGRMYSPWGNSFVYIQSTPTTLDDCISTKAQLARAFALDERMWPVEFLIIPVAERYQSHYRGVANNWIRFHHIPFSTRKRHALRTLAEYLPTERINDGGLEYLNDTGE
jgi:hypothetical protein